MACAPFVSTGTKDEHEYAEEDLIRRRYKNYSDNLYVRLSTKKAPLPGNMYSQNETPRTCSSQQVSCVTDEQAEWCTTGVRCHTPNGPPVSGRWGRRGKAEELQEDQAVKGCVLHAKARDTTGNCCFLWHG